MSDFMQLSETERSERLRHLAVTALGQWGFEDAEVDLIKIRENAVYRVTARTKSAMSCACTALTITAMLHSNRSLPGCRR